MACRCGGTPAGGLPGKQIEGGDASRRPAPGISAVVRSPNTRLAERHIESATAKRRGRVSLRWRRAWNWKDGCLLSRAHAVVSFRGWGEGLVWVVGTHASLEVQGNHAGRNVQVPWEDCGKPPCLATWASNRCELGAEEPPCQPFAFEIGQDQGWGLVARGIWTGGCILMPTAPEQD